MEEKEDKKRIEAAEAKINHEAEVLQPDDKDATVSDEFAKGAASEAEANHEGDVLKPTEKDLVVPEEVAEVLSGLSKEQRETIVGAMVRIEQRTFSGPLPHPELFQGYEQALPGAADRILSMTEKEQDHRHEMERQLLESKRSDLRRGQNFGFWLAVILTIAAVVLALINHEVLAGVIFGTTILGSLAIYVLRKRPIYSTKNSKNEDDDSK